MTIDYRSPAYYRQGKPQAPSWPSTDPIPEVLNTDPRPDVPVPPAVAALEALGQRQGWEVGLGYSTGPERAVRVGEYKQTEAWGVWAGPHPVTGWRWNAIHTRTKGKAWSWRSTALWLPGVKVRFTHAGLTDLKEFVNAQAAVSQLWFDTVEAYAMHRVWLARAAARNRPKTKKEGSS